MNHRLSQHDESACSEFLAYLFENETVLRDLAETYIQNRTSSENSDKTESLGDEGLFRVLGTIIWEIFSDNHEVVDKEGKVFDLGSWRGSGGFIADFLNARFAPEGAYWFGYMDFYGGFWGGHDISLSPLYVYFFRKLKGQECTWRYSPPAIYLIDFSKEEQGDNLQNYNPATSVLTDLHDEEEQAKKGDFRKSLEEHNEEMREKVVNDPPLVVLAYKQVYGEMPIYIKR